LVVGSATVIIIDHRRRLERVLWQCDEAAGASSLPTRAGRWAGSKEDGDGEATDDDELDSELETT
jgi:hypothetical protein